MDRLNSAADDLSTKYDDHAHALIGVKNMTDDIFNTLGEVAVSAATIQKSNHSYFQGLGLSGWFPYIISPVATLLLGSYGLAPSAFRNLGLIVLGEVVGFSVSHLGCDTVSWPLFATNKALLNTTTRAF